MEEELAIQNNIKTILTNAIKAELLVMYPSRAYDGSFKPKGGGATPRSNRNYTGNLSKSVTVDFVNVEDQLRLQLSFPGAPEWFWVDEGRRGKQQDPSLKYPPLSSIDRWVVAKPGINLSVRDKQGKFIERKSLVYLIQRSIGLYGYYGIRFINKAVKLTELKLEREFGEYARVYFTNFINDNILVGPITAR